MPAKDAQIGGVSALSVVKIGDLSIVGSLDNVTDEVATYET